MSGAPLHDYDGDFSNLRTLPEGWEWSTLEDITDNHDGQRVPVKVDDRAKRSGPYPYYGASGIIDDIDDFIFDGEYLLIAEDGANLLSRRTPVAFKAKGKFWVNNHAHVVTTREPIPLGYLEHYIEATNLQFFCTGTAQPKLNQKNLNRIPVPIAPPKEQKRIVSKIEELFSDLDAGVSALERARANLRRYRASVLKSAVEGRLTQKWRSANPDVEPASELLARILRERRQRWEQQQLATYESKGKKPPKNWQSKYKEPAAPDTANLPQLPEGWCWATLSQVSVLDRGKSRHRPRNAKHLYGGPYPFVQTGDIRHAETFINEYTQTYSEDGLAQSRMWPIGTLCITIAANIAETAILGIEACFPDSVVGLLSYDGVSVRYVELFVRTARERLEAYAPATAQKNINLGGLNTVAIPMPPETEQLAIVEMIDEKLSIVQASEKTIDANQARGEHLRQSILKSAFEGNLTTLPAQLEEVAL